MSTLYRHENGMYFFEDNEGTAIHNPFWRSYGRFRCLPSEYGFAEWNSGGGIMLWRRVFELENQSPVVYLTSLQDEGRGEFVVIEIERDELDAKIEWVIPAHIEQLDTQTIISHESYNWE